MTVKLIGALTSKPYAFTARSWELKNVESIDLFDSSCSNIKIDIRGSEIMRILPINNEYVNEEWISDKTRFAYDSLKRWRFTTPLIKKGNTFIQTSWKEAFTEISAKIKSNEYKNIILNTGNFTDLETLTVLKQWTNNYDNIIVNHKNYISCDLENYSLNLNTVNNVKENSVLILAGINLRFENPILNIKIRKLSLQNNVLIGYIGSKYNNNLNSYHLGNNCSALTLLLKGKHDFIRLVNNFYKKATQLKFFYKKVQFLLGGEFLKRKNSNAFLSLLHSYQNNKAFSFNFNYLLPYSGQINVTELNLKTDNGYLIDKQKKNIHYLIGSEDFEKINKDDFVIFQGHHNDLHRIAFDVILPSYNWTEKSALYINNQRVIQKTNIVCTPPIQSRLDWKIIRMISILIDKDVEFNSIGEIHKKLENFSPNLLSSINKYELNNSFEYNFSNKNNTKKIVLLDKNPFKSFIPNFYKLTSVERSSKIMSQCSETLTVQNNNFLK